MPASPTSSAALATQMEGLKRQARQARRYRELSVEIRKAEAVAAHVAWSTAEAQAATEESALGEVLVRLGAAVEAASGSMREEAEIADSHPAPARGGGDAWRHPRPAEDRAGELRDARLSAPRSDSRELAQRARATRGRHRARERRRQARPASRSSASTRSCPSWRVVVDGATEAGDRGALRRWPMPATSEAAAAARQTAVAAARLRDPLAASHAGDDRRRTPRPGRQSANRQLDHLEAQRAEIAARAPRRGPACRAAGRPARCWSKRSRTARARRSMPRSASPGSAPNVRQSRRGGSARGPRSARSGNRANDAGASAAAARRRRPGAGARSRSRSLAAYEAALGAALGDDLDAPVGRRRERGGKHRSTGGASIPQSAMPPCPRVRRRSPARSRRRRELERRLAQIGVVDRADGPRLQQIAARGPAARFAPGRPVALGRLRGDRGGADGGGRAAGTEEPPRRDRGSARRGDRGSRAGAGGATRGAGRATAAEDLARRSRQAAREAQAAARPHARAVSRPWSGPRARSKSRRKSLEDAVRAVAADARGRARTHRGSRDRA